MYDNLNFGLKKNDVSNIDFLNDVPQYLDRAEQINFENGTVIRGALGNKAEKNYFEVSVSSAGVNLRNGSLCKYCFGDNFKTLERHDVQRAIEQISDTLHLPFERAVMYRIDVAQNFILQYPIEVYLNHLGEMKIGRNEIKRIFDVRGSLYYRFRKGKGRQLVFYDKLKEQRDKGRPVPELYRNRNVLRMEHRHTARLSETFNVKHVTAAMLYDERFYIEIINKWRDAYRAINKINDAELNLGNMTGIKDFHNLGTLALIEREGSELALLEKIKETQQSGQISKKAAYDIRQDIKKATRTANGLTVKNEHILELDRKVAEAVKFYR